jgi:phosphatidylserine decarboxylase
MSAFGVGSINDTYTAKTVAKMDEKGYFTFGGSTLVLLFEKDRVAWSDDLLRHSAAGYETLIQVGETIGQTP